MILRLEVRVELFLTPLQEKARCGNGRHGQQADTENANSPSRVEVRGHNLTIPTRGKFRATCLVQDRYGYLHDEVTTPPEDLLRRLRSALVRRVPATVADDTAQRAAVAVIVSDEADPAVLFVRRQERDGDPWSGHIAFPGGFASPADDSAAATAARETEEETGLPLSRDGERLGPLDDVAPRSVYLPRITVTPVVFALPGRPAVTVGPEIASASWIPARQLFDPANRRPFHLDLPTGRREFESIEVGGLVIWGLTERVLAQIPPLLDA